MSTTIPTMPGPDASTEALYAYLNAKRGTIVLRSDGSIEAQAYVLRDESEPDTYHNRHWYQAERVWVAFDHAALVAMARKVFGAGTLRETTDAHDRCFSRRAWAVFA